MVVSLTRSSSAGSIGIVVSLTRSSSTGSIGFDSNSIFSSNSGSIGCVWCWTLLSSSGSTGQHESSTRLSSTGSTGMLSLISFIFSCSSGSIEILAKLTLSSFSGLIDITSTISGLSSITSFSIFCMSSCFSSINGSTGIASVTGASISGTITLVVISMVEDTSNGGDAMHSSILTSGFNGTLMAFWNVCISLSSSAGWIIWASIPGLDILQKSSMVQVNCTHGSSCLASFDIEKLTFSKYSSWVKPSVIHNSSGSQSFDGCFGLSTLSFNWFSWSSASWFCLLSISVFDWLWSSSSSGTSCITIFGSNFENSTIFSTFVFSSAFSFLLSLVSSSPSDSTSL